jgi:thiol-disulfide isomerase/thioredoxin
MAAAAVSSSHPWSTGKCVVLFSAPWCGHCQSLKGTWSAFTKAVEAKHPGVKVMTVNTDKYDTRSVKPDVFGFPTIRAYQNGEMVREFDADRTQTELLKFVRTHLGASSSRKRRASQTAGRRPSRRQSRRRRQSRKQRGGGVASCASAIGKPFDVPSKVAAGAQWSGPYDQAPASPYNGGLYTGPAASGPHAPIPVTPTAAKYIHENLRSASGTPQSTTQYPTAATHRPGNNWSAMPGVYNFANQGTGPHRIHCTGDAPAAGGAAVGGGSTRRRLRRRSRGGAGLQLRAPNLDDGAPFHPEWARA